MRASQSSRCGRIGRWVVWLGAVWGAGPVAGGPSDARATLDRFRSNRYGFTLRVPRGWQIQTPPVGGLDVLVMHERGDTPLPATLTVRVAARQTPVAFRQQGRALHQVLTTVRDHVRAYRTDFRIVADEPIPLAAGSTGVRLDVVGPVKGHKVRQVWIFAAGTFHTYVFGFSVLDDHYAKVQPAVDQVIQSIQIVPTSTGPLPEAADLRRNEPGTRVALYRRERFGFRIPAAWRHVVHRKPAVLDMFEAHQRPGVRDMTLTVTCRDWLRRMGPAQLPDYLDRTAGQLRTALPGCRIVSTSLVGIGGSGQAAVVECALTVKDVPMRMVQMAAFRGQTVYMLTFMGSEATHLTRAHVIPKVCESFRVW